MIPLRLVDVGELVRRAERAAVADERRRDGDVALRHLEGVGAVFVGGHLDGVAVLVRDDEVAERKALVRLDRDGDLFARFGVRRVDGNGAALGLRDRDVIRRSRHPAARAAGRHGSFLLHFPRCRIPFRAFDFGVACRKRTARDGEIRRFDIVARSDVPEGSIRDFNGRIGGSTIGRAVLDLDGILLADASVLDNQAGLARLAVHVDATPAVVRGHQAINGRLRAVDHNAVAVAILDSDIRHGNVRFIAIDIQAMLGVVSRTFIVARTINNQVPDDDICAVLDVNHARARAFARNRHIFSPDGLVVAIQHDVFGDGQKTLVVLLACTVQGHVI